MTDETGAANAGAPSSAAATKPGPPLTVSQMWVTVYGLHDLPRQLSQLDARSERLEIVLQPTARYYYKDQRVNVLELPDHVIAFSPAAIEVHNERFSVDLETMNELDQSAPPMLDDAALSKDDTATPRDNVSYLNSGGNLTTTATATTTSAAATSAAVVVGTAHSLLLHGAATTSNAPGGGSGNGRAGANEQVSVSYSTGGITSSGPNNTSSTQINYVHTEQGVGHHAGAAAAAADKAETTSAAAGQEERGRRPVSYSATSSSSSSNTQQQQQQARHEQQKHASHGAAAAAVSSSSAAEAAACAETTPSSCLRQAEATRSAGYVVRLQFPSRADLKVIIEVFVGVRQRCLGASALRWLTPSVELETHRGETASFAAAEGEVQRYKIVNRFVSLNVGNLTCSFSVPHVGEDLRLLPGSARRIAVATERLVQDDQRLSHLYEGQAQTSNTSATAAAASHDRRAELQARLARGESELAVYKQLLAQHQPQYYVRRVQRILDLYPPTGRTTSWVANATAHDLVAQHRPHEEELLRRLCVELGPDCSSISPRIRRTVHRFCYKLTDEEMKRCIEARYPQNENLLDYEPDLFMQTLVDRFGAEVLPWRYAPAIAYAADDRMFFFDALRYCGSRAMAAAAASAGGGGGGGGGAGGASASAAAAGGASAMRPPLMLTPNERPLKPIDPVPPGTKVSEIHLLLEKYRPEFHQLIPPIAEAMEMLVKRNEALGRGALPGLVNNGTAAAAKASGAKSAGESVEESFDVFYSSQPCCTYMTILSRLANYTYISPSSMLAAVIYLDRICLRYPGLVLTRHNIERLFVTAVRVASKVVDVRSVDNKNFASVFCLSTADMNEMETQLLQLMLFNFFLSPDEFNTYSALLRPPQPAPVRQSVVQLSQHHHAHSRSSQSQSSPGNNNNTTLAAAAVGEQPRSAAAAQVSPRLSRSRLTTSSAAGNEKGTAGGCSSSGGGGNVAQPMPPSGQPSGVHSPRASRTGNGTLPPATLAGREGGENSTCHSAVNAIAAGGGGTAAIVAPDKTISTVNGTLPRAYVPSTMRC